MRGLLSVFQFEPNDAEERVNGVLVGQFRKLVRNTKVEKRLLRLPE